MSENKKLAVPKIELGSAKQALPLLGILMLLLAGLFLWSGVRQWREGAGGMSLMAERDRVSAEIANVLKQQRAHLANAAATEAVKAAAEKGDAAALKTALEQALSGSSPLEVDVLAVTGLDALYAKLPESGYGRLAVAEEARGSEVPVIQLARGKKESVLMGGVHFSGGHVALVSWPASLVTAPFDGADVSGGYLGLRQGSARVVEKGEMQFADTAETGMVKVTGSGLRVAAGVPEVEAGILGLGWLPSAIIGLLLALGGLALLLSKRLALSISKKPRVEAADEPEMTLEEMLSGRTGQPVERAASVPPVEPGVAGAGHAVADNAAAVNVAAGIFRAYDIRGVVGKDLDADTARAIGQAIGSLMQEQGLGEIVVGRDGRLSGPMLVAALTEGLRSTGCKVIDIGLAPTPLVYYAAYRLRTGSCVAVTGSHNPPDYNGFKIVVGGQTLSGEAITALYTRIREGRLHRASVEGELESREVGDDYIQRVASDIQLARPLRVVVDAGNGAAGELGPRVLSMIGAQVIPLYCEIDGNFPNHHPDPSEPHNLEDLIKVVQSAGADVGIAFDGDGDRLGVVTPQGHNIFPDRLLMLFARDVLDRQPGAVIVYDVKCSGALTPFILRHGGSPLMWKTGHSFIKQKMREEDAELAGEMSGHFFFKERWFGFDDGIYAAARFLEILAGQPEDADQLLSHIPDGISTPELKIGMENPHAFIKRFVDEGPFEGAAITDIDGLRADWPDGWGLVRASNTTPVMVLRFEARDEAGLARIKGVFRERLLALQPGLEIPF